MRAYHIKIDASISFIFMLYGTNNSFILFPKIIKTYDVNNGGIKYDHLM